MELVREQHLGRMDVTDVEALCVPATFFEFSRLCKWGKMVDAGTVLRYGNRLWRVAQGHVPQAIYPPGIDTAALYTVIEPYYSGTEDDPVSYEGNMVLEEGKWYEQDGVKYRCVRGSGMAVYNELEELVGIYVERV